MSSQKETPGTPTAFAKLPPQDVLPFPPTPSASIAGRTMQESVYQRRVEPRRLPADAPNILIVLIDDAGPGLPTTFGGEVHTPALDRISREGISYNRFHTTAMCSPTRASLLTGRNHHRSEMGGITEIANDCGRLLSVLPKTAATAARMLETTAIPPAQFGKWHNMPCGRQPRRARSTLAHRRRRLRIFLWLHRRRGAPVVPERWFEGDHADRVEPHARAGLSLDGRHDRQGHRVARAGRRRSCPTSPSSCTSRPAPPMRRTTSRRNGRTSTKASSTTAGTSFAKRRLRARRSWA